MEDHPNTTIYEYSQTVLPRIYSKGVDIIAIRQVHMGGKVNRELMEGLANFGYSKKNIKWSDKHNNILDLTL